MLSRTRPLLATLPPSSTSTRPSNMNFAPSRFNSSLFSLYNLATSLQSQVRNYSYKLKSCSSYKLRFRKSKSAQSEFIKRGYTMHGHKRTGETHQQHLKRAGDAPLAKGYVKKVMRKMPPR